MKQQVDKQYSLVALRLLKESLQASIKSIDELNGRLEEVVNHMPVERDELSESANRLLEELGDLYLNLPVWSTIEELISRIDEMQGEINEIRVG